jgi:hypothetical protein
MKIPSVLAGVAGEYFVAAELSRRGHIASISLRNTRGIDIIATNRDASRSITIQCKTNQLARKVWILNEKSENLFQTPTSTSLLHLAEFWSVPATTLFRAAMLLRTPARSTVSGCRHQDAPDVSMLTRRCGSFQTWTTSILRDGIYSDYDRMVIGREAF